MGWRVEVDYVGQGATPVGMIKPCKDKAEAFRVYETAQKLRGSDLVSARIYSGDGRLLLETKGEGKASVAPF